MAAAATILEDAQSWFQHAASIGADDPPSGPPGTGAAAAPGSAFTAAAAAAAAEVAKAAKDAEAAAAGADGGAEPRTPSGPRGPCGWAGGLPHHPLDGPASTSLSECGSEWQEASASPCTPRTPPPPSPRAHRASHSWSGHLHPSPSSAAPPHRPHAITCPQQQLPCATTPPPPAPAPLHSRHSAPHEAGHARGGRPPSPTLATERLAFGVSTAIGVRSTMEDFAFALPLAHPLGPGGDGAPLRAACFGVFDGGCCCCCCC